MPKTKGISISDLKRWALFGLVDKVGIVSVMSCASLLGIQDI